jgi:hypothetical protein
LFLFVVLGARLGVYGGGRWRKITGVEPSYFVNFGNSLLFYVMGVVSLPTKRVRPYLFSIMLFMPDYVPVMPLPDTTVESDFKLKLKLRLARRSTNLVNEGYGYITIYSISLGQRDTPWFIYEVKILEGDARLDHTNFITKLPMLAPVSVLS